MSAANVSDPPLSASAQKQRLLRSLRCGSRFEKSAWSAGARFVAGVDEVGRGCLFGPVVAAACILDPARSIRGLRDSKLLTAELRQTLSERIRHRAIAWAVAEVDASLVDQLNIRRASLLAMKLAVERLDPGPDFLLVDGRDSVDLACTQQPIIHGDALSISVAAASILAKVHRDAILCSLDAVYPQYGLALNKGYGTPEHKRALQQHGPTALHRRSYAPVALAVLPPQQRLKFSVFDRSVSDCAVFDCTNEETPC